MNQVKRMMSAGVSLPTAIKEILSKREPAMTLAAFAEKHGRSVTTISNVINGNVKPSDDDIAALVAEFGDTAEEWKLLLWEHSRPDGVEISRFGNRFEITT